VQSGKNERIVRKTKKIAWLLDCQPGKKERTNERKKVIHDVVDNVQSMNESCHTYKYVVSHI